MADDTVASDVAIAPQNGINNEESTPALNNDNDAPVEPDEKAALLSDTANEAESQEVDISKNDTSADNGAETFTDSQTHTETSTVVEKDESGMVSTTKTTLTTKTASSTTKLIKTQIVSNPNMESRDNPFLSDGELSKKADYILEHSRISRSEIRISDPDLASKHPPVEEQISPQNASADHASPGSPHSNGKVEEAITPQSVKLENATPSGQEGPATPADTKKGPKDKTRGKCCVVQ